MRLLDRRTFVAGAAAVMAGAAFGCSPTSSQSGGEAASPTFVSPYNWEGLQRGDLRWDYFEGDQLRSRWGVDVSEHQQFIDWPQVAEAGVEFAFVRIGYRGATEGILGEDDYFFVDIEGAAQAGIQVESYFFSQAVSEEEAQEEAAFAIAQVQEANRQGAGISIIAYDHEPVEVEGARANSLGPDQLTANAQAFCRAVEAAGFQPLIYGNRRSLFQLSQELREATPLWLAEYNAPTPTAPLNFQVWQYSCTGEIPGIPTNVDLNIWFEE